MAAGSIADTDSACRDPRSRILVAQRRSIVSCNIVAKADRAGILTDSIVIIADRSRIHRHCLIIITDRTAAGSDHLIIAAHCYGLCRRNGIGKTKRH